jgi:hypothetical protein
MSGFNLSNDSSHLNPSDTVTQTSQDHPLGLTVHSLPVPEQSMADDTKRVVQGRWRLALLLLVCAAPVIASYFTYYVVRPDARRNFGELIQPQRPVPALDAVNLAGQPVTLSTLKGQWLLVSVGSGACGPACEQQLYLQRQLRESLGKEKERVDRLWFVTDAQAIAPALQEGLKGATVLRVPQAQLAQWLAPEAGHGLPEHLYVVDPMGNWMMRFPAQLDMASAAKAKRDLERLLRASASWDPAGR